VKLKVLFVGMMLCTGAMANQENALPTCYEGKLQAKPVALDTELFVAIDQTTLLDVKLKQLVADNVKHLIGPNNGFSVMTFSAYTQGQYTSVSVSGKLDAEMDEQTRNDIAKPVLTKFDQCMKKQPQMGLQLVGSALRGAFDGTSSEIAKSDVLASLKAISSKVRQSKAQNKVVLIVSDMLENSSVSSFYGPKAESVRKIEPAKELSLVEKHNLAADFGGARVYIIGAGLLSADSEKAKRYRDPITMQTLSSFWGSYFQKSNAKLMEFGQPALLNPVR